MHDVEAVLFAEEAPDNGDILDDYHEGNCAKRARHAQNEAQEAKAAHAERLDRAYEVEVQVCRAHQTHQEVKGLADRYGIEGREPHVRGGQGQREPAVEGERQAEARAHGQLDIVHHQEDALDPAFPLLQKVPERERRLLPHLAVDPVERVALGHGRHGEVGVLGDAAFKNREKKY